MSKEELERALEKAKKDLKELRGPECEVFSRVVGYLRPVQNWNKGKKEEYHLRKTYTVG